MSSRYNQNTADDLFQQIRVLVKRIEQLEAPSGVVAATIIGSPANVVPTSQITTPPVLTTSPVMTPLFRLHMRKRSNTLAVILYVAVDVGSTGSVQLQAASPALGPIPGGGISLTSGQVGYVTLNADMSGVGTIGVTDLQVDVCAQRDSGAGNVRLLVAQANG